MNLAIVNGLDVAILVGIVLAALFVAYALRRGGQRVDSYHRSPEYAADLAERAERERERDENWSWPSRNYKRGA